MKTTFEEQAEEFIAAFPKYFKAVDTGFFEPDDMMDPDSDYALEIVEIGGIDTVLCQFETKYINK